MRIHDRIEAAFEAWGHFVVRHRLAVAGICLLATFAFGAFLPRLVVDNSTESFLRPGDPSRKLYDEFREQFGQDEKVLVAIHPPEVFELGFLNRLRALHEDIEREVPYVEEITSLWNARNTRGVGDELRVDDLMEDWPESAADVAALRERVFDTPSYRNMLVNEDGTVTSLVIEPYVHSTLGDSGDALEGFDDAAGDGAEEPAFLTEGEKREFVTTLQEVVARHESPDFRIYVAGGDVVDMALTQSLMRDSTIFLSTGLVLMAGILFLLFRRASGVLLPVATVLQTLVVTYGVMALIGLPTSMSGQMLPVLVMVVGISSSIHVVAIVYRRLADGMAKEDAIAAALGHSGLAILMASLTTAGGLISFSLAPMGQIANLGRAAPIGVVLTFVYSVTFLPAVMAIVPLRSSRYGGDALQRRLANALARIGDAATARPGAVLLGTALVAAVAGLGVARLSFSQDAMRWFPEDDPNRIAQEFLDTNFGGGGGVEVWIDTGRENGLHDPDVMARLAEAGEFAAGLEAGGGALTVGNVLSVADLVKETHKALNENRSEFYALPTERALLAQELLLFENSGPEHLEDLVDSQLSMARVSLRTPFVDGLYFIPFLQDLDGGFREIMGEGVEVRVTGIGALMGRTFTMLNVTMAQSYAIALLVITPLMVLLIGDLRRGLLSMIPNLLPIWLTLGLMGLLGIPLDNSTLLIGCILIGLAVDDTIHFMHQFQRYYSTSGDARQAVRDTLQTTGAALLFTTLVLTAGFMVMLLGYMNLSKEFGMLATFAAITAFVADLIVSPALMVVATRAKEPATAAATAD